MSYYFNTTLKGKSFEEAIELVTAELKKEGFGVLTEIDVKETLKNKIDVDFKKYKILGTNKIEILKNIVEEIKMNKINTFKCS